MKMAEPEVAFNHRGNRSNTFVCSRVGAALYMKANTIIYTSKGVLYPDSTFRSCGWITSLLEEMPCHTKVVLRAQPECRAPVASLEMQ